jgi:putative membrane protein insertion efficiency factor
MLKILVIKSIRFYQTYISPRMSHRCVFNPTCSEYAILAIEKYGLIHGIYKTINRLYRCRPGNGGYDPP